MASLNAHATALVVGSTGVLVAGPSGSGKSLLALSLIEAAHRNGAYASLVSDDQVWLSAEHGRVVAEAPKPIAGLIEVRGYGPTRMAFEARAVIDRVVRLVEPETAPRLREPAWEAIAGISLPCLVLAARNSLASAAAIAAWLEEPSAGQP